ncbi:MAG: hypothetical protein LBK56_03410 [Gracilibacteraceae bacterium]|jgi:hypothetical protein|nr:hypothetical protein [Gracilibacteraceae bacterium]
MEKFIPYEKLSKKQQRERDREQRLTWGALRPVTRKPPDPQAYRRQRTKTRQWRDTLSGFDFAEGGGAAFFMILWQGYK